MEREQRERLVSNGVVFEALREPGVRAVLEAVSGALIAFIGTINLLLADGRTVRAVAGALVVLAGSVVIASGVRTYRRLRG